MIGEFSNIRIQGMASAVPKMLEENDIYTAVLGKRRTKKQIKLTGVLKRHLSNRFQRTSDLCYAATVPLMKKLNWKKEEIKVLIFISQTANYVLPSTAFFLQKRLGIPKDCVCFDINLGCSSFNVGVHVVSALLQSCGIEDKALLLIGDVACAEMDPEEDLTESSAASRMLFGAAGAAIAMEKVENSNLKFMTKSDGNGFEAIIRHFGRNCEMDGNAVFEFAINEVSEDVKNFKKYFSLNEEEIDYYVFHQAQKLILDNIILDCKIPAEKELRSLEEYGNTSGTSVPLTVCYNREKFKSKESVKLFLCGFGVGLSWGSIYTEVPVDNILPVIETDEHYDDDKVSKEELYNNNILVIGADKMMGEHISRYLDRKGAKVVLAGTDEKKLCELQKDMFEESQVIINSENRASFADKVVQYCKDCECYLDGIVFAASDIEWSMPYEVCALLYSEECLKKNASIVFTSNIDTYKQSNDKNTYYQKREELENIIEKIQNEIDTDTIRVNAVLYHETEMDAMQFEGDGQEWIHQFLQEGCPLTMKRPLFVGKAVTYLLSKESQYTTGALLPINK